MEFKQIQELIKTINKSSISELTIEENGFKIVIRQEFSSAPAVLAQPAVAYTTPVQMPVAAPAPAAQPATQEKQGEAAPAPAAATNLVTVKSPMIGTFYRSPSPDKPAFVAVGDDIKAGQVLCIIEAMKLFNEIESEVSGKIVKVLVDDSSPVEYDQPLFLVEPA
ncbi:MAG: acetyl-CoA carboxylase biotin carboxyl carrier protein [Chitinophagia bacterium]|nr:acetyl-CoA carboxylase biotin carboxyl carrier protein [Chitinophagia bacterium]